MVYSIMWNIGSSCTSADSGGQYLSMLCRKIVYICVNPKPLDDAN